MPKEYKPKDKPSKRVRHYQLYVERMKRRGRVLMEPEELKGKLRMLFDRRDHWSLHGLALSIGQPEQHVKWTLRKMAMKNKKAPHQGMYALRPKYKWEQQQRRERLAARANPINQPSDFERSDEEMTD